MKRNILRLSAVLVIIAVVLSLSACKPKSEDSSMYSSYVNGIADGMPESTSNLRDISSIDLGEVETIVDKDGRAYVTPSYNMRDRTVSFLSHWYPEDCLHLITYMEKYGGPKIEFLTYNYGECGMKLQAMVLAGTSPDVYKIRYGDMTSLLFANVWSDITDKFDWDNRNWCELEPYLQYVTLDGKILAAPEMNANYMIWFNKSLFQEYGVEDPLSLWEKNEWTLDKFNDICRKLTIKEGGNTSIYGFGYDHCWFNEVLAMFDTDFVTYDGSKYISNVDDPKLLEAFSYITQMGHVEKTWSDMSKANAYFASGKQAMLYYGNWLAMSDPYRSMNISGKIDFVPVPENTATGLGPRQDYGISGHAIPVGAKNVAEACAFIEIFNFFKQTPELDMVSTKADCELSGISIEQFFRYRSCRYYENPYTLLSPLAHDEYLLRALKGESWYVIRETLEPTLNLTLDAIARP